MSAPDKLAAFDKVIEIKTESVQRSLEKLAAKAGVHRRTIDLDLLSATSWIKPPDHREFIPLSGEWAERTQDDAWLQDPKLLIRQVYHVRFRPARSEPGFKPLIKLQANSARSEARAILLPGSRFDFEHAATLEKRLHEHLTRLKLKNGMLIGLRDQPMRADLGKLIRLLLQSGGVLSVPQSVVLAWWIAPVLPQDDRLEFCFGQRRFREREGGRVDYADRGFAATAEPGDLLAVYHPPQTGQRGRDYGGRVIEVGEPTMNHYPEFGIDEKSVAIEKEGGIWRYRATTKGVATLENGQLCVEKLIDLKSASLKETGHVETELDQEVNILIRAQCASDEVVGPGMRLKAKHLLIEGSVGAGASLEAESIEVRGMVHQSARIIAREATIAVHKGELEADYVLIENLEGGSVQAKRLKVTTALGAQAVAESIEVELLRHRNQLTALKGITLSCCQGGENHLLISTPQSPAGRIRKARIETLEAEQETLQKSLASLLKKHRNLSDAATLAMEAIKSRPSGAPISQMHRDLMARYQQSAKAIKEAQITLKTLEEQIQTEVTHLNALDEISQEAKILNTSGSWCGENRLMWQLECEGEIFTHRADPSTGGPRGFRLCRHTQRIEPVVA